MARKKKAPKSEFPEELFVTRDTYAPEIMYVAETAEGIECAEDGVRVGVYTLCQVLTRKVDITLE